MKKIKPITLYAEAVRWIDSKNFLGKTYRDKPAVLMDTDGYEVFCKAQIVGRESVKIEHWYEIEKMPSNRKHSIPFEVIRIVPKSHLTPEQYKNKQSGEQEPPKEKDWEEEILALFKEGHYIALRNTDIHELLLDNTKRERDYSTEERKKYKEIGTITKRMHNNAKLFRISLSRDGRQNNSSHVFYGVDPDAVLSKIEYRGHLKLVQPTEQETIYSLKNTKWDKSNG